MPPKSFLLSLCILTICMSCEFEEHPAKVLPTFSTISSNGSVTFKLVEGVENAVISTTLDESWYNVSGGNLSINAAGGTMTIAARNLRLLWCNGCSVESDGLLADTLVFYIHGGSMKLFNAQVNNYLELNAVNIGRYRLSGYSPFFNFTCSNLASIEAYSLVTDSTYFNTTSISDAEVNATQVLNGFINSIGGVNYKGNPPIVRATINGMGRLVKKN